DAAGRRPGAAAVVEPVGAILAYVAVDREVELGAARIDGEVAAVERDQGERTPVGHAETVVGGEVADLPDLVVDEAGRVAQHHRTTGVAAEGVCEQLSVFALGDAAGDTQPDIGCGHAAVDRQVAFGQGQPQATGAGVERAGDRKRPGVRQLDAAGRERTDFADAVGAGQGCAAARAAGEHGRTDAAAGLGDVAAAVELQGACGIDVVAQRDP